MSLLGLTARVRRFASRNQGRLASSAWTWFVGRAYAQPITRRLVSRAFPARQPEKWAFLVGCYNSGTTILREVLGAHPSIGTLPREGVVLTDRFPDLQADGWTRMLLRNRAKWEMPRNDIPARVSRIIHDWSPMWARNASVFLEKSITHSVRMPWLEAAFKSPHFITIVRNGYCVCEGVRRRAAPTGKAALQIGDDYPMTLLGEQWVAINVQIDDAIPNVRHVISISYEELFADPVAILQAIFTFLGVEIPPLSFREGVLTMDKTEFRIENMNASSLARLSSGDLASASEIMSSKLRQHGYAIIQEACGER